MSERTCVQMRVWMRVWALAACGVVAVTILPLRGVHAQEGASLEQVIARARAQIEGGSSEQGRVVLDSLVQVVPPASPALAEVLYWRGLLATSGGDAERDWRRLVVEVPLSPRVEDALLRLAQFEQLRGRPAEARMLLERLARDYASPASQARAHFWLARAWFSERDAPRGCGALDVARAQAPEAAVELRAQMEEMRRQCRGVTAVRPVTPPVAATTAEQRDAARRDSVSAAISAEARRDSLRRAEDARREAQRTATADSARAAALATAQRTAAADSARAAAPPATPRTTAAPTGRFSVQLAAHANLPAAESDVRRLKAAGIDARVDGTVAPFRVRVGFFATRAQAAARLAEYKARGMDGFIAELTP